MLATLNCPVFGGWSRRFKAFQNFTLEASSVFAFLLASFACVIPTFAEQAGETNEPPVSFAARAHKRFIEAQTQFRSQPDHVELALKFGQTAFDWAEFASGHRQREEIALEGIEVCRSVIGREAKSAPGHYYLAMNLGQLAQTKSLGALKLVNEMEKEFQIVQDLDENFDFAGPNRNLGLLYSEAPGWPTSIGSHSKARHHLQRAVLLKPNYPENRLNLLEAYLKWGDKSGAIHEFQALKELWPGAKKEFSGEQWEASWADWDRRWEKIQAKFPFDKVLESPRNKK